MPHVFRFDLQRSIQATAFLLRRETAHRMNYMRLLKILYICERESLAETGKPITGSRVIAMQRGPVLEDVLGLIRCQHFGTPEWSRFLRTDEYQIAMTADPGVGHLSRFVTRKLESVAERFAHADEWEMVQFTHTLPEWIRNDPGESSKEIPLADILEAVGRKDDLQEIIANARRDAVSIEFFSTRHSEPSCG